MRWCGRSSVHRDYLHVMISSDRCLHLDWLGGGQVAMIVAMRGVLRERVAAADPGGDHDGVDAGLQSPAHHESRPR